MKVLVILANFLILAFCTQHEPRPPQNFNSLRPSSSDQGMRPPIRSRPPPPMSSNRNPIMRTPPVSPPTATPSRPRPVQAQPSPMLPSKSQPQSRTCQRLGPPSRPISHGGKQYWFSWMVSDKSEAQQSWQNARLTCQRFCMDLANIESKDEDNFIQHFVKRDKVYGLWIGGQTCQDESCITDKKVSWIWQPTRNQIDENGYSNWSPRGARGTRQPDDYTNNEACLAILNNWYDDGAKWHDLECGDVFPFVCENHQ